ncbi:MAG: hypothetical protein GXP45_06810 [bacterium]|nr:hypothetical protein [bacterium]
MFIQKVDQQKLKTFLKEDSLYIDKILPYAVAFGLQNKFIKKISKLIQDTQIHTWYI